MSLISICFAISDKGGPYTSRTSPSSMKLRAKRIVEPMESTRKRVTVKAFPYAIPNKVYTLNVSERVASQQLLEDIMSLSRQQTSIPLSSRNVKEAVIAKSRILKAMSSDPTSNLMAHTNRSVHLFLLASQLDDGTIYLLPEVFMCRCGLTSSVLDLCSSPGTRWGLRGSVFR